MNISVDTASKVRNATPLHNAICLTEGGALFHIVLNGQI